MNILINTKLSEFYPNLANPTINSYTSNISKVLKLIDSTNLNDLYLKYNEIIDAVKKEYSEIGTQKCKYSSCSVYIKTLLTDEENNEINNKIIEARKKYNKEIEIIKIKTIKILSKFEKTESEESGWITDEEKLTIANNLLNKIPNEIKTFKDLILLRNYIVFKFFCDLASRCECALSKLLYDDEFEDLNLLNTSYNYIILHKTEKTIRYIINQHKNANRKGPYTVMLAENLYDLFDRYKKELVKFKINWFLPKDSGIENLSYTSLSQLYSSFGNIINKKIFIRVNRKIATSKVVKIAEIQEESRRQGHSFNQAIYIYSKK